MGLEEREIIDRVEVLPESGHIQVRVRQAVVRVTTADDGSAVDEEVSWKFHRYVLEPGANLEGQPEQVATVARAAWGIA